MTRKGLLLFLACGLAWGVPYFFIRIAVEDFSAPTIIFARVVIGAAVLAPMAIKSGAFKLAVNNWKQVLAFALIEMAGPWYLITEAEQKISSGLAGLLIATVPIWAFFLGYFYLGDKSIKHYKNLIGLAVGFVGVFLLVGIDSFAGKLDLISVGAVLLAAVGYAVAPAMADKNIRHVPTVGVISVSMLIVAAIYAVPAGLALPKEIAANPAPISWVALLVLGLVCSALAFVLYFQLLKEVGSARSTFITYMNTAIAIALGILFLNEELTAGVAIGFPLVLLGSYWASQRHAVKPAKAAKTF